MWIGAGNVSAVAAHPVRSSVCYPDVATDIEEESFKH